MTFALFFAATAMAAWISSVLNETDSTGAETVDVFADMTGADAAADFKLLNDWNLGFAAVTVADDAAAETLFTDEATFVAGAVAVAAAETVAAGAGAEALGTTVDKREFMPDVTAANPVPTFAETGVTTGSTFSA